jgi:hypothetical protein
MQIAVLIEPVPGNGFRARGGEPFALAGEGPTPEEALGKLKESLQGQLAAGARIVSLDLPTSGHAWLPFAGMFPADDPLVQEWVRVMTEARYLDEDVSKTE